MNLKAEKSRVRNNIRNYVKNGECSSMKLQNLYLEAKFHDLIDEFPDVWDNVDLSAPTPKIRKRGFTNRFSLRKTKLVPQRENKSAFSGKNWTPSSTP